MTNGFNRFNEELIVEVCDPAFRGTDATVLNSRSSAQSTIFITGGWQVL
jgi:hypothetical protein